MYELKNADKGFLQEESSEKDSEEKINRTFYIKKSQIDKLESKSSLDPSPFLRKILDAYFDSSDYDE